MRSQANERATCVNPEIEEIPVLKGSSPWKAALPEAFTASRGETGGVVGGGTLKEDGPVTWEAPVPSGR